MSEHVNGILGLTDEAFEVGTYETGSAITAMPAALMVSIQIEWRVSANVTHSKQSPWSKKSPFLMTSYFVKEP